MVFHKYVFASTNDKGLGTFIEMSDTHLPSDNTLLVRSC